MNFQKGAGGIRNMFFPSSSSSFTQLIFLNFFFHTTPGLQKMFSLSGTFKSNGQNFLPNMCAKRTSRARSGKSLRTGSRARLRALEAQGILMLSGAIWAYV